MEVSGIIIWFGLFYILSFLLTFVLMFMFTNVWIQMGLVSIPLAALLLERKKEVGGKYR